MDNGVNSILCNVNVSAQRKLDGQYSCNLCNKTYVHQASFYNHMKYTCGKRAGFFCRFCSFSTKYAQHLQHHMMGKHNLSLSRSELKAFSFKEKWTGEADNFWTIVDVLILNYLLLGEINTLSTMLFSFFSTQLETLFDYGCCYSGFPATNLKGHRTFKCTKRIVMSLEPQNRNIIRKDSSMYLHWNEK